MSMAWEQLQYPQREFSPPTGPEDAFDRAIMVAVLDNLSKPGSQPTYPIEYRYWVPSVFFQMEPDDQVNPAYLEAWQNQSMTLMPEYSSEYLWGDIQNMPYFTQQLSTPIFSPDGKGVRAPGQATLLTRGAGKVTLVGNA